MTDLYQIDSTKIQWHPKRITQWLDAGDDLDALLRVPPIYVEISPVGQCNHRCTFCSVDYIGYKRRRPDDLRLDLALGEMANLGVKSIMFAGEGEPLLHDDIAGIINRTCEYGIDVAVTTNATALTPELSHECLESVTWLKASVNAGTRETYAKIHQTKSSDFHRVIANLGDAVDARKKNGWKCTLGAQMVVIPDNAHEAGKLAGICKGIGLDYLVLKPYSQNPHSEETATRGFDKMHHAVHQFEHTAYAYSRDGFNVIYREKTVANLEHDRPYQTCHSTPFFWAYVMASGDVYGCSAHLLDERFNFGNINHRSFSEIWHGEKRRACIEMMRSFDLSSCRKNCRMDSANRFLWKLRQGVPHQNFI